MLYPKQETLSEEVFRHPPTQYRGAPFWAWNCKLDEKLIDWELPKFQEMGMGGFHMHVRTGLDTPYLSDEFMARIKQCVDWAAAHSMRAYLYDEDRFPSGAAGGMVTADGRFRAQYLAFSPEHPPKEKLLAAFDVQLDEKGYLIGYTPAEAETPCPGRWFAYCCCAEPRGRHNGHSYVDMLNPAATRRFIALTHERYAAAVGEHFGTTIPSIFTDEPRFSYKQQLPSAFESKTIQMPWTDDLPETFAAAYHSDLLAQLPELFWELPAGRISKFRYQYHEHVAERFAAAYADVVGAWCDQHGLLFTGHLMDESTLEKQSICLGEAMRSYRSFSLPGIDMLCHWHEYTTIKQCQSVVHQYDREGMMCELYGVTGWDFDFRGHKLLGDWQAALGVTLRVPHLSWMSMAGDAKRDYPASIFFQSPWYREYPMIEDHFARINTALTRGKPIVRVAVVHPIESYWLHWGPADQTTAIRQRMETHFHQLTEWLLFGSMDFDFLCESLLPELCPTGGNPFKVGAMAYDAVIVSDCETLRATTLERLEAFQQAGGKLIFLGDAPALEDGGVSSRGRELWECSTHIAMERDVLLHALEDQREITLLDMASGRSPEHLVYQLRQDGSCRWLFLANGKETCNPDIPHAELLHITLRGCWKPMQWDTMTGEQKPIAHHTAGNVTIIEALLNDYDSLLLHLEPVEHSAFVPEKAQPLTQPVAVPSTARVQLEEPNVLVLDQASYALDEEPWQEIEELLRIREKLRAQLGWKNDEYQPWVRPVEKPEHQVRLRFTFCCNHTLAGGQLALEDAEKTEILLDGESIACKKTGWYVDPSIRTVPLPVLHPGAHVLELSRSFTQRTYLEWAYLLGDFRISGSGRKLVLEAATSCEQGYASQTEQGCPFYGGNVSYSFSVRTRGGALRIHVPHWRGALLSVSVDGTDMGRIALSPYTLITPKLEAGSHEVTLTLFGTRANTFGPLHLANEKETWIGPDAWHSRGDAWTYEYRLKPFGILSAPRIEEIDGEKNN